MLGAFLAIAMTVEALTCTLENPVDMSYIFLAIVWLDSPQDWTCLGSDGFYRCPHAHSESGSIRYVAPIHQCLQNQCVCESICVGSRNDRCHQGKDGIGRLLNVLWTSKKSAKIQFIKPLTILTEINTIHIVGVVGEAKSLTI